MFNCEVTPSLWLPGAVCQGGESGEAQAHHLLRPLPGDGGHEEAISWRYRGSVVTADWGIVIYGDGDDGDHSGERWGSRS